jgi:hypothetical protein
LAACPWRATTHAAAKCNTSRRSITLAPPRRFQNLHPAIPRTCLAVQRKAAMPQRSYLTPTLENRISRGSTQSRNAPKTPGQLQMTNPNSQWILPRRDAEFAEKKGRMISFSAPSATYSSSKVIHRWRGETGFCSPQPSVNNFGGGQKMYCQQPSLLLNRKVGHAGTGRRILRPNVTTFSQRLSLRFPALRCKGTLRTFRLQEQSWQRRTPISLSPRRSPRAPLNEQQNGLL